MKLFHKNEFLIESSSFSSYSNQKYLLNFSRNLNIGSIPNMLRRFKWPPPRRNPFRVHSFTTLRNYKKAHFQPHFRSQQVGWWKGVGGRISICDCRQSGRTANWNQSASNMVPGRWQHRGGRVINRPAGGEAESFGNFSGPKTVVAWDNYHYVCVCV